jgi:hypothetical protein
LIVFCVERYGPEMEVSADLPDPCDLMPVCPICGGKLEVVYDRRHVKVCVCVDCHTGVYVPVTALAMVRSRRLE